MEIAALKEDKKRKNKEDKKRKNGEDKQRKKKKRKGKKHKDEGTSNPSQQRRKDQSQNETTPEKVLDDSEVERTQDHSEMELNVVVDTTQDQSGKELQSAKSFVVGEATVETDSDDAEISLSNWSTSSSEPLQEGLCVPTQLTVGNLPVDVTEEELINFFGGKPIGVYLDVKRNKRGDIVDRQALVNYDSPLAANEGLKLNRTYLRGVPLNITPQKNNCEMVCINGIPTNMEMDDVKRRLHRKIDCFGKVLNIFLPKNSTTGCFLGFAYIYLEIKPEKLEELYHYLKDIKVHMRMADPKSCFYAEMEGNPPDLHESEKTRLKKVYLPIKEDEYYTTKPFSWREKAPDIIPRPFTQIRGNCWSVALTREYNVLRKLTQVRGRKLTPDDIEKLVDPSKRGIGSIRCAKPAMEPYVKKMEIHRRPRGNDVKKYEQFEQKILSLLAISPVMVTMEYLPGFSDFDGVGIYRPSHDDLYMRTYEHFDLHCLNWPWGRERSGVLGVAGFKRE